MSNWSARAQAILVSESFEARVSALLDEAIKAGDHEQVRLCEIALGVGDVGSGATGRQRAEARDECARVLASAEVQAKRGTKS